MPAKRKAHAWLADALELERAGWSRTAIADALGVTRGTVLRVLWTHHNPAAAARSEAEREMRRRNGNPRGVVDRTAWSEAALTETWEARKARLSAARGLQRPGGPKS